MAGDRVFGGVEGEVVVILDIRGPVMFGYCGGVQMATSDGAQLLLQRK